LVWRLVANDNICVGGFKGDIYYGLWYTIIIALITFVIGILFVKETKDNNIYAKD